MLPRSRFAPMPPATLGSTAEAHARLIVWCRDCRYQVELDPAGMAERYGAELSVPDWQAARLRPVRQTANRLTGAKPRGACTAR
jgi:hypothetical protein